MIGNGKVWLRLIPRIDLSQKSDQKSKPARFTSIRPPQRAFNLEEAKRHLPPNSPFETKSEKDLGSLRKFILFKRQLFRKGFLYKAFTTK